VSEEVNKNFPARNTTVQLFNSVHRPWAPQCTGWFQTARETDLQTDDRTAKV